MAAYDEIVVITRADPDRAPEPLPPEVSCRTYTPPNSITAKACALGGMPYPAVRAELSSARRLGFGSSRAVVATVLMSWMNATSACRQIRSLAAERDDVHVYSYWADDMAIAAALAKRNGWVQRAWARAHGWDVYMSRTGYLPFRRLLAEHLDALLFVSDHGRRYFESMFGARYPSVGYSRLGTPAVTTVPLAPSETFTVLSCSRLIPLKRVERIAQALHRVMQPVRWIHIGDGPSRRIVRATCATLPTNVSVELRGTMSNADVMRTYEAERPSVFLSVSEAEGLPVSMMEAMSAGIPVIGSDVGGVKEIISHGRNGRLLAPDPDPSDVADAIELFAGLAPLQHRQYAEAAWATWHTRFNAERNFARFLEAVQG